VDKGGSRREGVSDVRMGESSPRKRRDIVLGPGPAREEWCDEENERRDERCTGTIVMGSDLEGVTGGA
jgi:hypothetical protein